MSDVVTVSVSELADLLELIFLAHNVSAGTARILAENCAGCERDGTTSHGIFRIPGYVSSLDSRWVDGRATAVVESLSGAFIRVDAANGFAQPALALARQPLLEIVRANGVGVVAIRNSHHFSALWPDVEPFAPLGLVALSVVNSFACVVPHGGRKAVFGTNPMAFASPVAGNHPFVFDQSSSAVSNGDVQIAARDKHILPVGSGVDSRGNATNDPNAVLNGGALRPFGGHKGANIALMIEILAAAVTGGLFSNEVDFTTHPGAQTPRTGQLLIVIDPQFGGANSFGGRVAELISSVHAAGGERIAGERRFLQRARSQREGMVLKADELDALRSLAQ